MFARPGLCGMGIGRLGLVAASQPSLVAQALAILAKYGSAANLYLPGVGAINGITAGNWLDSIGTTAATVDGQVGLALDSMGVLGAELVTNGDFSAGTAGWNAKSATISTVGGELSVLAASTAQPSAAQAISTVSGKTYKISARLRADAANAVAKSARVRVAENGYGGHIYSGPYEVTSNGVARELTAFFTAPIATVYVLLEVGSSSAYGNVGDKAYFDNISVRELPGAHLTQSTAANRPVLRLAGGVYAWDFVSSDSFTSTMTPGNAGFFCSVANVTDSGVLRTLLGAGAGSDASSGVLLARDASNALTLQVGNGITRNSVSAAYPVATNAVASAGWDASNMFVGINGAETSGAKSVNCTSANTINLGVLTGTTNPMLGTISGGAIIMPTVLPTSTERATLRQFIASLSGVTL